MEYVKFIRYENMTVHFIFSTGHVPVPHLRNIKSKYLSELQTQSMHLCFVPSLCDFMYVQYVF